MLVHCPLCNSESATVQAPSWSFSDTSVEVSTCSDCREAHGVVSVRVKTSALAELAVAETSLRHATGLVAFR